MTEACPPPAAQPLTQRPPLWLVPAVIVIFLLNIWGGTILIPGPWGVHSFQFQNAVIFGLETLIAARCAKATLKDAASRALFLPAFVYSTLVLLSSYHGRHGLHFLEWVQPLEVGWAIWVFVIFLPNGLETQGYRTVFKSMMGLLTLISLFNLTLAALHRESFLGHPLLHNWDHRGGAWSAQGIFLHRNTIGAFLAPFPALICALVVESHPLKAWQRLSYWISFLSISLGLFLSFSRSSQILAVFSLATPILIRISRRSLHRNPKLFARRAAFIFAAALSVTLYFRSLVFPYFFNLAGRDVYWSEILAKIKVRPWFGYGLLGVYTPSGDTPHNAYLAQVAYYGIVGFLAFLGLFAKLARQIGRVYVSGPQKTLSAAFIIFILIGIAAQGMVEYIITYPIFFTNTFFLLLIGYARRPRLA